jgi:hypothetical protein
MPEQAKLNFEIERVAHTPAGLSRRAFLGTAAALAAARSALAQGPARAAIVRTDIASLPPYGNGTIPSSIRARVVRNVNGLNVHMLEAGFETPGRPAVLLLHGFPELAYSWRKVMCHCRQAFTSSRPISGLRARHRLGRLPRRRPDPFRILNMVRTR